VAALSFKFLMEIDITEPMFSEFVYDLDSFLVCGVFQTNKEMNHVRVRKQERYQVEIF